MSPQGAPASRLRVATWSLERAGPRPSARVRDLQAHMAAVDADLWVLTETWRQVAPSPEHRLVASSATAPDRDAAGGELWTAIWSRLEATPLRLSAEPDRTAAARVTTPGGHGFLCYGTVLPWLSDRRRVPLTGAAAFVGSLEAQRSEWQDLRVRCGGVPLIVAGDFNQDLAENHYYGSRAGRAVLRQALEEGDLRCWTAGADDPLGAHWAEPASTTSAAARSWMSPGSGPGRRGRYHGD